MPGATLVVDPARSAALRLVVSALFFSAMALGVRIVAGHIPGPQTALVRFSVGLAATGVAWATGHAVIRPHRWTWLVARGLAGGLAVLAYFSCIEHVPVGVATLLNYTAPVFTLLFSWWLLAENPPSRTVIALAVTLAGVAMVVGVRVTFFHAGMWEGVGLASAVLSGLAVTSVRAARRPDASGLPAESTWSVFFSFCAFGALVTLPTVMPPWGHWTTPSPIDWALLVGIGLTSVVAQLIMTEALRHVTGATSGIIHQITVIMTMLVGVVVLDERLTTLGLIGSALTVLGVGWTVVSAERGK